VRFTADGIGVEASFSKLGPPAGRIRLFGPDRTIVSRPLATTVQDDYREWTTDPRRKDWSSNPAMKAVIGIP
jgi:hypothetical protein